LVTLDFGVNDELLITDWMGVVNAVAVNWAVITIAGIQFSLLLGCQRGTANTGND
jgi:hypothetical protein